MPVAVFSSNTGATYGGDEDVRLTENDPSTAHGTNDFINAGDYGAGDHIITALRPNLADFITALGGSDISINSLYVELSSDSGISTTGITISFYECLRAWVETEATWEDYEFGLAWTNGGGLGVGTDRGSTLLGTITVTSGSGYDALIGSGLDDLFLSWVNEAHPNRGIISDDGDISNAQAYWISSEGTDGSRPRWVLDYSVGQSVTVGIVTETDSAFSVSHPKSKTTGLASETDSVLGSTRAKSKLLELTSETDSALATSVSKLSVVGLTSETDSAFVALRLADVFVVQYKFTLNTFDNPMEVVLDFPVTSGNSVIMLFDRNPDFDAATDPASDDQSNSYSDVVAASNTHIADTKAAELFYKHNVTNGPQTFTVPWSDATAHLGNMVVLEVQGLANAAPVDIVEGSAAGSGTSSSTMQVALDTVTDDSFLVGLASNFGGVITGDSGTSHDSQDGSDTYQAMLYKVAPTAGSNTLDATQSSSQSYSLFAWAFSAESGGSIEVGLLTETDSALAVVGTKSKVVGLASETCTAQSLSKTKSKTVGLLTETDSAQVVSSEIVVVVGLVSETATAQTVARAKTKATGLTTETDSAQRVSRSTWVTLTSVNTTAWKRLASTPVDLEIGDQIAVISVTGGSLSDVVINPDGTWDTAVGVTAFTYMVRDVNDGTWGTPAELTILTMGLVSDTSSAFSVSRSKAKVVGLNLETDSVLTSTKTKSKAAGLSSETDSSLSLSRSKTRVVSLPETSDTAFSVTANIVGQAGVAVETDSSLSMSHTKAKALALNTETGSALALGRQKARSVGLTSETSSSIGLTHRKAKELGLLVESDIVLSLVGRQQVEVGLASESDSALASLGSKSLLVGLPASTDSALPVSQGRGFLAGLAEEQSSAFGLAFTKDKLVGLALEADSSLALQAGSSGYLPVTLQASHQRRILLSATQGDA